LASTHPAEPAPTMMKSNSWAVVTNFPLEPVCLHHDAGKPAIVPMPATPD
jgi:hypothetical protein